MNIDAVLLRELQLTITMSTAWHFNIHLGLHTSFASPSVYLTLKPKAKPDFHHFLFAVKKCQHIIFPAFHSHARDSSSSHFFLSNFSLPIFILFPFFLLSLSLYKPHAIALPKNTSLGTS